MARLLVTMIDYSKPGSHRQRDKLLTCFEALEEAQESNKARAIRSAYRQMEETIKPYLRTDDGSPVEDAMNELSGDDFFVLWKGLVSGETVGEESLPS